MAATPIPIAIIGGGIFVKEQHLPAVLASPLLELKAIYSRTLASARAAAALAASVVDVDLYSDDSSSSSSAGQQRGFADVLARPDIAGVVVALPIALQPRFVEAALRAGKHVLSEKPVGPDVEGARRLIDMAATGARTAEPSGGRAQQQQQLVENKQVFWAVAEQFRFLPKYVWGAEQARRLGRVIGFNFRVFQLCGQDNKYYQTAWRKNPTHNYGFLLDGGVHHTAVVRMFLGADVPESVVGYSSLAQDYLAPVDTLSAIIRTKSGAVGSFNCSWGTTIPRVAEYTVACADGSVTIEGDKGWVHYKDGRREEKDFPFTRGAGVMEEVHAWAAAIAEAKENPLLTPETTLGDLELLEAMLKSADEGGSTKVLKFQ